MRAVVIRSVSLAVCLLIVAGCDSSSLPNDEEIRRRLIISHCESALANEQLSRQAKSRARLALLKWDNSSLDPEPIVIEAFLAQARDSKEARMGIGISDEDNDVAGIGVREEHVRPNGGAIIIEEEYPVFGFQSIGCLQLIPVQIRIGTERKNHEDWQRYLNRGVWEKEMIPDLWISIPRPGTVDVKVWVYDHAGHKSQLVPLEWHSETE
jgi:hypothetical protein